MSQEWYVRLAEGELGPLCSRELKQLVAASKLNRDDMVSLDKVKWVPAAKVEGLGLETEVGHPRSSETPEPEVTPQSEVSKFASTEDRPGTVDGELLQLLFSNSWQLLPRRLAAWMVDAFVRSVRISVAIAFVFALFAGFLYLGRDPISGRVEVPDIGNGRQVILGLLVYVGFLDWVILLKRDAGYPALGKRIFGIMAVDNAARPCTPGRSTRRYFLFLLVPALPIIEGVVALWRKDSRRLGDLIAGTSVVREFLPLLEHAIVTGRQDTVLKVTCWILQTEMRIPNTMFSKFRKRDANLVRAFRHVVKRQKLVCARLAHLNTITSENAEELRHLRSVVDQQLSIFRKIRFIRWTPLGLKAEHIQEFNSLQQRKIELVAKLR